MTSHKIRARLSRLRPTHQVGMRCKKQETRQPHQRRTKSRNQKYQSPLKKISAALKAKCLLKVLHSTNQSRSKQLLKSHLLLAQIKTKRARFGSKEADLQRNSATKSWTLSTPGCVRIFSLAMGSSSCLVKPASCLT